MLYSKKYNLLLLSFCLLLFLPSIEAQPKKRLKPPKRDSKVKSVDRFVDHAFNLYGKIFVYDSLTQVSAEIPSELEDELVESAERDIDSLWQVVPEIIEDISDASPLKKVKATLNLNKAKKALKYSGQTIKNYFVGTKEEEDN
jgi:hypothetical protein